MIQHNYPSATTPGGSELTRKASEKADKTAVFVSPSGKAAKSLYPAAEVGTWNSVPYPGICSNRDLISEFKIAVNTARPVISLYFCLWIRRKGGGHTDTPP